MGRRLVGGEAVKLFDYKASVSALRSYNSVVHCPWSFALVGSVRLHTR
jgi:hypothetical protein